MEETTTITYSLNEAEIKEAICQFMKRKKVLRDEIEMHVTTLDTSISIGATIKHVVI